MVDNLDRRVAIGEKLDISENDLVMLENAQRRKKHYYRILSGIEALIGLLSFMGGLVIGYGTPFNNLLSGYPYSAILMGGNIPSFFELKKKRGLLVLPVITMLIIMLGLISGYILGSTVAAAQESTAIKYNVYSKPLKSL